MSEIGERIRQLRRDAKLTQDELAELCGANRVTIANYELGKYQPSIEALERLAEALGTTPDVITGRAEKAEKIDDAWIIRERLRRDPDYQMLFRAAEKASPEHLRAATAVLKSFEKNYDDD